MYWSVEIAILDMLKYVTSQGFCRTFHKALIPNSQYVKMSDYNVSHGLYLSPMSEILYHYPSNDFVLLEGHMRVEYYAGEAPNNWAVLQGSVG